MNAAGTHLAGVWPRASVHSHVNIEVVLGGDLGRAHGALEGLLARVHPLVRHQRLECVEPETPHKTFDI